MEEKLFVGIDISKNHLDFSCWLGKHEVESIRIENKPSKISMYVLDVLSRLNLSWSECVFCMEHTGIYGAHLIRYLSNQAKNVYVVNPTHLKKSLGMTRGKNDKIDASRIARFIMRFWDELLPYTSKPELKQLQALMSRRTQLVNIKTQLKVPMADYVEFADKATVKQLKLISAPVDKAIIAAIKAIDNSILQLIKNQDELNVMYKRILSVPGVGPVLASHLLVITNGFTRLTDPRKLACYAGVVPFEHSSGSSIRGRSRVSHFANKKIKTLLHLGAMRVIQLKGEFQEYFQRKKNEGKHAMSILNAIRNKIVHRICAVINQQKNYQNNLQMS